ncbi:hypothetical protein MIND_00051300 [Mycena indigotica]|uniref:RNA polymerase II elongation factor ELL N-terminal domain-containing protein n=1 Tax=Mycena indigotica TaxID=2126181 RepID=A0A8H6TEM5_9AGAR|nr:uncharacterized protein MIND_00051300 [Mycena indigotica]KAF7315367.1 hypothetical protein MIND_00051300 [Mycena indigotica]
MSLPADVKLTIHRPSEPHAKQAMIVRMSTEVLNALQANPRMQFSFGPKPGIIIGDTTFPMRAMKENSHHDLYLRAPSAAKPLAPLKLYANITGKFTVERDLNTVQNEIRSATQNMEKSRSERATIILNAPPPDVTQASRKKKNGPPKKPVPRSSVPTRVPSPLPPPSVTPLQRVALIKALASKERGNDELFNMFSSDASPAIPRKTLQTLLDQIAEQHTPANSITLWRLKPRIWTEVRPYEWHDLPKEVTEHIARTARFAFGNLNIPDTDPVWVHVRFRNGETSTITAVSKVDPPKRGLSSKEAKEKKMKPKANPKAEMMIRDQTMPGPSTTPKVEQRMQKEPGSGFKASKTAGVDISLPSSSMRPKPVDPRREVSSTKAVEDKKAITRVKTKAPDDEIEVKDSLKRKKPIDGASAPAQAKRRKTEPPPPMQRDLSLPKKPDVSTTSKPSKADSSLARPSHKSKYESATVPPTRPSLPTSRPPITAPSTSIRSQSESTSTSKAGSHRSSQTSQPKRRDRRSPIYTSSEDEGEPPSRKETPLPTPPSTTSHRQRPPQPINNRPALSATPRTDRDSLRASYKATYRKYLSSYQQLYAQQSKLESLRDGHSDSEVDIEVLSAEETMRLKADFNRWEKELVNIRSMFERGSSKSD